MLQHLLHLQHLLLLLLTALRMCNSLSQVLLHVILQFLLPQEGAMGVDGLHHLLRCGRSAAAVPRRQASGALAHFGPPIMGKQGEVAAHRFCQLCDCRQGRNLRGFQALRLSAGKPLRRYQTKLAHL